VPKKAFLSRYEQVAVTLRDEIQKGHWKKEMPGRNTLARELGVNHKTVESAMLLLEKEGLLERQGAGRGRKILSQGKVRRQQLQVVILIYEKSDLKSSYLITLEQQLQAAGYKTRFAGKTLRGLGMNLKRITRYVATVEADAWIVLGGPRDVLAWFSQQPKPVFALFGRMMEVNIAGAAPLKGPSYQLIVRRLVELGHRRISMLVRSERRHPVPGLLEQRFLDQLAEHGIESGSFNLPDWDDSPAGFHRCLDSLFEFTPPTALIISQPEMFMAAQQHLALEGIYSPRDVSLICSDASSVFDWCQPNIAHIRWDHDAIIKRVLRWAADQVSRGVDKRTQSFPEAEFVEGGTIGPAPKSAS